MPCQSGGVNDFDAQGGEASSFGGALQNAGAEQEGAAREAALIGGQGGGGLNWSTIGGSIIENFAKDFKPAAGASPAGISGMTAAANNLQQAKESSKFDKNIPKSACQQGGRRRKKRTKKRTKKRRKKRRKKRTKKRRKSKIKSRRKYPRKRRNLSRFSKMPPLKL